MPQTRVKLILDDLAVNFPTSLTTLSLEGVRISPKLLKHYSPSVQTFKELDVE